ncbi:MAG: adenylyl-sulfate kinase [Candidatus Krumholzibacteriota bacterium]|nr:adenylyl-sulfate kinase [Candidatus Krumholzibacteriota bacterium]
MITTKLYSRARKGEIKNLPGVDVRYEKPVGPDLDIDVSSRGIEKAADDIIKYLNRFM